MITQVIPPVWIPDKRQWLVEYIVKDQDAGDYIQKVWCEALVSAQRYIELLKQRKER